MHFLSTTTLLACIASCMGTQYAPGTTDPILTFSPMCGSPGDVVTLTAVGECLPPVGQRVTRSAFFGGASADYTVTRRGMTSSGGATCEATAVVPEGASSSTVQVTSLVESGGSNSLASLDFFTVPCPDAGTPAVDAGTANADTTGDLDAVHSDPALDIATSQSFVDQGRPWIRVTFAGAWPRPAYYSHYVKVMLRRSSPPAEAAAHTDQLHDGVASTMTTGVAPAKITFVPEANGFRLLFDDPALMFDSYSVECGVLKTMGGMFVQDTSGPFTFERTERAFGP
jgi:hypothetical protein